MTIPTIIAIDPGAISGAMAFWYEFPTVSDLPVVNGQLDAAELGRTVREMGVQQAVVERVGAMPKQGVASTFKFGFAAGAIYGVLAAMEVPVTYVTPAVWKKHFKLIGKDKEAGRALAIQRHPMVNGLNLKKHHGRADALLILDWFMETHHSNRFPPLFNYQRNPENHDRD